METLENILYHSPHKPRTRKEPMQVMAFGLSRSGTDSLCNALKLLGYTNAYHGYDVVPNNDTEAWMRLLRRKYDDKGRAPRSDIPLISTAEFDAIIGHCTALTDMPCAALAPELFAAYPGAKVILNVRKDLNAWHRSTMETFGVYMNQRGRYIKSFFDAEEYWLYGILEKCFVDFFYGSVEHHGIWVYRDNTAKIRGMVPPENLLEWSVEDGWEPLCRFLGKSMEGLPSFPSGNTPEAFQVKTAKMAANREARIKRNMSITGAAIAAAVGIASWMTLKSRGTMP